jgi:hypothetical protein
VTAALGVIAYQPCWVFFMPAADVIPDYPIALILHADCLVRRLRRLGLPNTRSTSRYSPWLSCLGSRRGVGRRSYVWRAALNTKERFSKS